MSKIGSESLTLSGDHSNFSGDLTVSGGTLSVVSPLTPQVDIVVSDPGQYIAGVSDTIQSINGSGDVVINASATLAIGADEGSDALSGDLSGGGSLIKQGSGTFTLSGNSANYQGNSTVSEGQLIVSSATALGSGNEINVNDGAALALQNNQVTESIFNFANQINLGSEGSLGASLELASGSFQISEPIHILNDALIRLKAGGSELLLGQYKPDFWLLHDYGS